MNANVMRAILAMDSYNRGYGQGVNGIANNATLGTATFTAQSDINPGSSAVSAGFYASAYDWNGRTVISYRGTNPETAVSIGRDIWSGWRLGLGYPAGGQPELAIAA